MRYRNFFRCTIRGQVNQIKDEKFHECVLIGYKLSRWRYEDEFVNYKFFPSRNKNLGNSLFKKREKICR